MLGVSRRSTNGVTLAALRRETAVDHGRIDALIEPNRLVEPAYYAAVVRGMIESAEAVEATLPLIPPPMRLNGLSPTEVSKRVAIDTESSFLDVLVGPRPERRPLGFNEILPSTGLPVQATMTGVLYVYVGSGLGGLHLLRFARTATWWRHEREHVMLQPYGRRLKGLWRAVLNALESLDPDETSAAVTAARAGFDLHHRSLLDHVSGGGAR